MPQDIYYKGQRYKWFKRHKANWWSEEFLVAVHEGRGMQCLAHVSAKTIAVRGWKWLPGSYSPSVHLSSLNTFCWGWRHYP